MGPLKDVDCVCCLLLRSFHMFLKYPPTSLLPLPVLSLKRISVGVVKISTGLMLSRMFDS